MANVTTSKENIQMPIHHESSAVALARAHAEAWSNHDWDTARKMLAPDVHVTTTTTQPIMDPTDLTGIDDYMHGLIQFAQAVEPGSARDHASAGDERNSLIVLTVRAAFGPDGAKVTLPAARLALFDENQKIKKEQVVFFAVPD
jgi:SnoaL-like protein